MECKNEHMSHVLLFYFRKGNNATQAAKKLRDVYGEKALKDSVEIGLINFVLGIFHFFFFCEEEIVHYVPRRRMRVIAGRATMPAGDRS